ncbi:entericidin A/B family lipoprotein [Gimibacter soli]|uniref:Entericidin A/B family lipoprotein n=1 Tax=Gimibacter soli TaxID=3024400 RepID=A0AAE9XXT4_9PROT|nr:entericidin A/B family lipoprotein [Gimibacter soli]WCL55734.1 entericidin A/B family lipoprotein [Gimibacter soli]
MKKTLFILLMPLMALFAVAGCNTIEGAGEDLESAGDAISDAAK